LFRLVLGIFLNIIQKLTDLHIFKNKPANVAILTGHIKFTHSTRWTTQITILLYVLFARDPFSNNLLYADITKNYCSHIETHKKAYCIDVYYIHFFNPLSLLIDTLKNKVLYI